MNLNKANEINFSEYKINSPYPENIPTNLDDLLLYKIKKIYAGRKGEFTSINQHMYQYFILYYNEEINYIARALKEISLTESIHFDILTKILINSNIDPKICTFIDNNPKLCNFWSASNISYSKDIVNIIKQNIELEEILIIEYNQLLENTDNDNLMLIIKRILEDKNSHLKYFKDIQKLL